MKKKSKKQAIVKVETRLAKTHRLPSKVRLKQYLQNDLKAAETYRDHALKELKTAVLVYCTAEAAVAGAYLETLSAGNALGRKR
jgi:hypothetical protein